MLAHGQSIIICHPSGGRAAALDGRAAPSADSSPISARGSNTRGAVHHNSQQRRDRWPCCTRHQHPRRACTCRVDVSSSRFLIIGTMLPDSCGGFEPPGGAPAVAGSLGGALPVAHPSPQVQLVHLSHTNLLPKCRSFMLLARTAFASAAHSCSSNNPSSPSKAHSSPFIGTSIPPFCTSRILLPNVLR